MADNLTTTTTVSTIPSGTVIATDEVSGVHYQKIKLAYGVADDATLVSASAGLPVAQQGTWTVTATISGTPAVTVSGSVAVTGTFWQATQPVSGTFWQATQPVSVASVPSHDVTNAGVFAVQATLASGTNNIGDVDVLTVPADPFGANADAASATGSISAKLRFIAATGIPITGTATVAGTVTANAGTNLNTSLLALESGGNLAAAATSLATLDDIVTGARAKISATRKITYAASADLTISLASLATSSTWVAGVESAEIDNSSNLYTGMLIGGKITAGTTPANPSQIQIWVFAQFNDTTYPDVLDGTASTETITSVAIKYAAGRLAAVIVVDATTSDRPYYFAPFNVADLFGGVMPRKYVVFVTHNTGSNLNSSAGNHVISMTGITETWGA